MMEAKVVMIQAGGALDRGNWVRIKGDLAYRFGPRGGFSGWYKMVQQHPRRVRVYPIGVALNKVSKGEQVRVQVSGEVKV